MIYFRNQVETLGISYSKIIRGHKYKDKDNGKDSDKDKDTWLKSIYFDESTLSLDKSV